MSRILNDSDGDSLRIEKAAPPYEGVVLSASQRGDGDTLHHAIFGPINPHVLIEAIKAECELHEDDEVHDSPVVEEFAAQINSGQARVNRVGPAVEEGQKARAPRAEEIERLLMDADRDGGEVYRTDGYAGLADYLAEGLREIGGDDQVRGTYVHTTPVTAEEPRVWAGADEPIIDSLIGRVADLEDEKERTEAHSALADHWTRRLAVARSAISMTPRRGESKPVGIMATFGGTERSGEVSVTDALKIARFAADEDRDIPGVDA